MKLFIIVALLLIPCVLADHCNETVDNHTCSVSISLSSEKDVYLSGERIKFYNTLTNESYAFKIEYWIEDENQTIVKKPVTTQNVNEKSYTPKIKEEEKILFIKNRLLSVDCNNTESKNESFFRDKGD